MKQIVIQLGFLALCFFAYSDVRVWEDRAGNKYEAEFVRELFDKVTLRTADGREIRFGVEKLSDHDQKYLRVMVAPQIAVDCKVSTDQMPPPWDLFESDKGTFTRIDATVTIEKISKRTFTSRLTAELYLIANEVDGRNFVLLSRTVSSFLLLDGNHSFAAEPVVTRAYREYNNIQIRGEEYLGYLAVVLDAAGNTVHVATNIGDWIQDPGVISNLRETALRGEASLRSRHFDKSGRKAEVPRPLPYLPGNR